jgi:hypothetical protein
MNFFEEPRYRRNVLVLPLLFVRAPYKKVWFLLALRRESSTMYGDLL